jgi:hypothetical protein
MVKYHLVTLYHGNLDNFAGRFDQINAMLATPTGKRWIRRAADAVPRHLRPGEEAAEQGVEAERVLVDTGAEGTMERRRRQSAAKIQAVARGQLARRQVRCFAFWTSNSAACGGSSTSRLPSRFAPPVA